MAQKELAMMGKIEIKSVGSTGSTVTRRSLRNVLMTPIVCSILASFGIFGGISSLFVGIVFVIIHSFIGADTIFDRMGTGLLIIAIPMILIGAIFLDEIKLKK